MPYPPSGRADKFGNRYESTWLVKQFLQLIQEEISSVTLEPIGDEECGVDIKSIYNDGSVKFYQCKGRNKSKEYWSLSDLNSNDIFEKIKKQLDSNDNTSYYFISAASCLMLNDISSEARNSDGNAEDFYNYQILKRGEDFKKNFKITMKYLKLNIDEEADRKKAFNYLKRIYVILYPDDINSREDLKRQIKFLFNGDAESIYHLLAQYPIEKDLLGMEITLSMLNNYLKSIKNMSYREISKDERVLPQILDLNNLFKDSYSLINKILISRTESKLCYDEITKGNSLILHGKAGYGKSGCILELINKLESEGVMYLALKLDRRIPEHTSKKYGETIGLPESPVLCLDSIAKSEKVVIILDQLDAIRWTNMHSTTALEVCKEMFQEVNNINRNRTKKISIVCICRTFDLENDSGIKTLFNSDNKYDKNKADMMVWEKIRINELLIDDVKKIVDNFDSLTERLKQLLRIPSNLYIWSNLSEQSKLSSFTTSYNLIEIWWEDIKTSSERDDIPYVEIDAIKNSIVKYVENLGKSMVPHQLLSNTSKLAINKLKSAGLIIEDNNKHIGFVHQSFYDYFLVDIMFNDIITNDKTIIEAIGSKDKQTPNKRYQLQILFEILLNQNPDEFVIYGREVLLSDNVRFIMKTVFLEVLGQITFITKAIENFIIEFFEEKDWQEHILDCVIVNHPVIMAKLIENGFISDLLKSTNTFDLGLNLLRSVNDKLQNEVTNLLEQHIGTNLETDNKILNCLCWNIYDDSLSMFKIRLDLYSKILEHSSIYIDWDKLLSKNPERAVQVLDLYVRVNDSKRRILEHTIDQKALDKFYDFSKKHAKEIWYSFMSLPLRLNIRRKYITH